MGYEDHKTQAGKRSVACAVITCSDSRTKENDTSGDLIRSLLESAGHTHPVDAISKDEPAGIRLLLSGLAAQDDIQAIILNGGTGVSRRDNTFDAVSASLTKTLPGFGEVFRMLSYQEIGSGAMLSRDSGNYREWGAAYGGVFGAGVAACGGFGDGKVDFAGVGAFGVGDGTVRGRKGGGSVVRTFPVLRGYGRWSPDVL